MNSNLSRRRFLEGSAAVLGVSLVGCGPKGNAGAQSSLNGDGTIAVSGLSQLSNGTAVVFTFPDGEPGLIYTTLDGKHGAVSAKCTHQGCVVEWNMPNDPKVPLRCPCHESHFALDGKPLSGPAKLPLKQYKVALNGDTATLTTV